MSPESIIGIAALFIAATGTAAAGAWRLVIKVGELSVKAGQISIHLTALADDVSQIRHDIHEERKVRDNHESRIVRIETLIGASCDQN